MPAIAVMCYGYLKPENRSMKKVKQYRVSRCSKKRRRGNETGTRDRAGTPSYLLGSALIAPMAFKAAVGRNDRKYARKASPIECGAELIALA